MSPFYPIFKLGYKALSLYEEGRMREFLFFSTDRERCLTPTEISARCKSKNEFELRWCGWRKSGIGKPNEDVGELNSVRASCFDQILVRKTHWHFWNS